MECRCSIKLKNELEDTGIRNLGYKDIFLSALHAFRVAEFSRFHSKTKAGKNRMVSNIKVL